jgi:hypothetical protein
MTEYYERPFGLASPMWLRGVFAGLGLAIGLCGVAAADPREDAKRSSSPDDPLYLCTVTGHGEPYRYLTPRSEVRGDLDFWEQGIAHASCRQLDLAPVYFLLTKSYAGSVSLTGGLTEVACEKRRG